MDGMEAKSAATESRKKGIVKRLDMIMDILDDKMEEATKYRITKKERALMILQEVSIQVKIAKDRGSYLACCEA